MPAPGPDPAQLLLDRLLPVLRELRDGDHGASLVLDGSGSAAELAEVINELAGQVREASGARIEAPGLSGSWRELAEAVEDVSRGAADPLADISRVVAAIAAGDFRRQVTARAGGELGALRDDVNLLGARLAALTGEVHRLSGEVTVEGRLGGRADLVGASGGWRTLVDSVDGMVAGLADQVRDVSRVAQAVARGDLSQKIDVAARGEILELKSTINGMVDTLGSFAAEVTRVAREVGTEGKLGGQARVPDVAGTWKDLTDNVNVMADNLTDQVRNIAQVTTAVAAGDLSKKIAVDARGEVAALAGTINGMVDTLGSFAAEVTRVAREVGTEGKLGGQARVPDVAGTWKDLTDNVNVMADNLTDQVRNIAQVTTAVAAGDLSKKIDVDARGEILELKSTINTMVDQLSAFAAEVTRVAREVGTEGKLGGQAEVADVSGTWRRLTESVNRLAGNLTTQVRAIAGVATAVAEGDLSRHVDVAASGEVAELKDDINAMIGHLRASTEANREQDWLKSNSARIAAVMQGCDDLDELARLITTELTPLVSAQYGGFYLRTTDADGELLERTAAYGRAEQGAPPRFRLGESLVGQAAADGRTILVADAAPGHVRVGSGLGRSAPRNLVVLPVLFEEEVQAVIELASVHEFAPVHLDLLERLNATIGVDINTIRVNSRTAALLSDSQRLAAELSTRSEQLQHQQDELRRSNAELADKAEQLAGRNRDIELKNQEIEQARQQLEQHAEELARASAYKSEFLANMSHELRTPLNSVLILAKLLSDNAGGNLTDEQVDLAGTIHQAGGDLLQMINDVLDLSKVEAGQMYLLPGDVRLAEIAAGVRAMYEPVAADRGLTFEVRVEPSVPAMLRTDRNRLDQILRNLVSNAVKFTERGSVLLRIRPAEPGETGVGDLRGEPAISFEVRDSGIGIPSDQLDTVFEAFRQADGTTVRNYGGTGLGLSISRQLAALLRGELTARSEPGRGSTFTLHLPSRPDDEDEIEDEPEPTTAPTAEESPEPGFAGQLVLLVDDDERGRGALATALRQSGLRVVEADGAAAGIRVLREDAQISAVLMDVMMPGMDGDAAIELIREVPRFHDLPVIAVTAKALPGDRERSISAGATDAVSKPVDVAALLGLLAALLPE